MATPDLSVLPKVQAQFIPPMLAKLTETPPDGSQWRYEIKLDGYRAVIVKRGKNVEVFSRRHNQISHKFPVIASAFERLAPDTALDGEIVALDDDGRPDFNNLQNWK